MNNCPRCGNDGVEFESDMPGVVCTNCHHRFEPPARPRRKRRTPDVKCHKCGHDTFEVDPEERVFRCEECGHKVELPPWMKVTRSEDTMNERQPDARHMRDEAHAQAIRTYLLGLDRLIDAASRDGLRVEVSSETLDHLHRGDDGIRVVDRWLTTTSAKVWRPY